jgi:hypothetical protein
MPELTDLEERLAALRKQIAYGRSSGLTPLEILQLRRDCQHLWAQIELYRREQLATLASQPNQREAPNS